MVRADFDASIGQREFQLRWGVMVLKGIKDTEKVAVGAIRTALQTWLAPQLSDISERLTLRKL